MSSRIRLVIVDDHPIVREGLQALISTDASLELVGAAANGNDAIDLVKTHKPDLILLDMVMHPISGVEVIHEIKALGLDVRFLILTSFGKERLVYEAIQAGAQGYLLKDTPPRQLIQAIYDVYNGIPTLSSPITALLLQEAQRSSDTNPSSPQKLTQREVLVLKHVAQGLTNQQIADQLVISERTARTHIANILRKLNLTNRTQAALYALRVGIASLDQDT